MKKLNFLLWATLVSLNSTAYAEVKALLLISPNFIALLQPAKQTINSMLLERQNF